MDGTPVQNTLAHSQFTYPTAEELIYSALLPEGSREFRLSMLFVSFYPRDVFSHPLVSLSDLRQGDLSIWFRPCFRLEK